MVWRMRFFDGCTALITGASAGLGAEFARQLAPRAHALILVARRADRLEALKSELNEKFADCDVRIYVADLADEPARTAFAAWLKSESLRVDFLINNAGLGDHGSFEASAWDRVRSMLDVNIAALTHLTHLLLPDMRKSGRAAILNVSSVASFFPLPSLAVYSATKAYVTSFSEALRMELQQTGVSVTALCPGPVETEFFSVATRPGDEANAAHFKTMPAFTVSVHEAVYAGLEAVAKDRARVVPGLVLMLAVSAAAIVPFWIIRRILAANSRRI